MADHEVNESHAHIDRPGPLRGLRVLDLSRVLAGPFCTMILGDLGAEVIKVEAPRQGDDTRQWGPPFIGGESAYFLSVNRNKRSIALNLKNSKARQIVLELAKLSDIVIENFRPGVAEELGVGYETLKSVNPRLVYCSISGFGKDGPYRDRPGYDIVMQAMGGFMGITGTSEGEPVRIGVAIIDLCAGLYATIAILAALRHRDRTGEGQFIDLALFDSSVSLMTYMAGYYFASGVIPPRMGSAHPTIVPYQAFKAKDGNYIIVAIGNDRLWGLFCDAMGLKDLKDDPRFARNADRVKNRRELLERLDAAFLSRGRDEWVALLESAGVPCGPVYSMGDIFSDPQTLHRHMLVEMNHPTLGKIKIIGSPMKFSSSSVRLDAPPPLLGQDAEWVLRKLLNYSDEAVQELRRQEAI